MSKVLKSILTRLNNKGTILSLAALVISLLVQFGVDIDSEKLIGIVLLNDPTENTNAYIPGVSDKLIDKE